MGIWNSCFFALPSLQNLSLLNLYALALSNPVVFYQLLSYHKTLYETKLPAKFHFPIGS